MSEQGLNSTNDKGKKWWSELLFLRIFQGFRMAVQPGKLLLALGGVVALFIGGWILDGIAGPRVTNSVAVSGGEAGMTEIEAYALGMPEGIRSDLQAYRERVRTSNEEYLQQLLSRLELNEVAKPEAIRSGEALDKVENEYEKNLKDAVDRLEKRYERRKSDIKKEYRDKIDLGADKAEAALARERSQEELQRAYEGLLQAMLTGESSGQSINGWLRVVSAPTSSDSEQDRELLLKNQESMLQAVQLAQAYRVARLAEGKGIFASIVDFKLTRLHHAISTLIWQRDLTTVGQDIRQVLMMARWLTRFHPIYALFLMLYCLVIWALFGGAICRMAALQAARDERIGPLRALQFSMSKFGSFFTAPLIPVGIIILIALFIFIGGLIGAIPVIGEWIAGLLTGLALLGGFVMALVLVGLIGGYNLMYPTIAVEGSDSFDAISRSFSYLFARPWRMGFYTLIMAVYGGVCYLFVRFFAFLLLLTVHIAAGASMNWDGSSLAGVRGKLDAIWPQPTFAQLQPTINWASLNWTESIGAFFIWVWVALTVGLVLAFVVSYFYSVNTIIYTLLRKHVDDTDLEDVFLEQDVEDLLSEETTVQEVPPAQAEAEIKAAEEQAGGEAAEADKEKSEEDTEDKKD